MTADAESLDMDRESSDLKYELAFKKVVGSIFQLDL